ncbi:hypothetical protein SOCE26_098190 [Sorangium cellulosum]|uniref:AttH domain-containing protein n=1 Tax=Sorangium cellulosum TaxID=56 RepID=A0A2L0F9V0_SORCE|nr:hypothetical protein SOCE26_098190 [Sorangium cellulosum]
MGDVKEKAVRARANLARFRPGQREGFYESFFQRANHPTRPLAFWIRYTLFSPAGRPEAAEGELWAVYFDGETGRHAVAKREVPFSSGCSFARDSFSVTVDGAVLGPGRLTGAAGEGDAAIAWDLTYRGGGEPLLLLPAALYDAPLPKAKSLVGAPLAVYSGVVRAFGRDVDVSGWVGSQNHNWGTKHTDLYAWGQVAAFDSHPDSFLEVATARLKIGPLWTPRMTPLVLRHGGEEIALSSLGRAFRAEASFDYFTWTFRTETDRLSVEGRISASAGDFVGLAYRNPPGGVKHCLNTKIAACSLTLRRKNLGREVGVETLTTARRAAFEILTDDRGHGVTIRA